MKAVLFDFDGIIIDSEWPIYQSWLKLFKREGHDLAIEDYAQCIGSDFDTWSPEKLLEKLTRKSFDWPAENAARQIEIESDLEDVQPLPGIIPLLQWLKQAEIPSNIVSSSTHRWVDMWVDKLALNEYFKHVVCREDAARIKPAPDLYLEGASRLGLSGSDCLVIEDSLNGVKAAKAANCSAYVVPSRLTQVASFAIADREFGNILEMSTALKILFER